MKTKLIAAILVGVALGLAIPFIARQPDALAQPAQPKAMKWEHKVKMFRPVKEGESEKVLDDLANDGWEYVGLVATGAAGGGGPGGMTIPLGYVAFKRAKK